MRDTPIPHDLFVTIQSVLCERLQGWASFIFAASRLHFDEVLQCAYERRLVAEMRGVLHNETVVRLALSA